MIYNYEILNPVTDNKQPFYDFKRGLFCFKVQKKYKYYVECARINEFNQKREYYIILGEEKFDDNCRPCSVDMYGRCKIKVQGEMKDYIVGIAEIIGNIEINYAYSQDGMDVWKLA